MRKYEDFKSDEELDEYEDRAQGAAEDTQFWYGLQVRLQLIGVVKV